MFIHHRTRGFLIKEEERGEADKLFTFYTEDFGKLEILGKAVRKINSKLKGSLSLFSLSEIEFIQAKTYKTLTDAILGGKIDGFKKDLELLETAHRIAEVLDELVGQEEKDPPIWQLVSDTFSRLNARYRAEEIKTKLYYFFLWRLLSLLGYQPELYTCPVCQRKLSAKVIFFSPNEGGTVCPECAGEKALQETVRPEAIKIIRIIIKNDWPTFLRLKFTSQDQDSLAKVSEDYLKHVLVQTGNLLY